MKNLKYFVAIIIFFTSFSCKEDFLERFPLDAISDGSFWNSKSDVELYVNQFYNRLYFAFIYEYTPSGNQNYAAYLWNDNKSDNMQSAPLETRLAGLATVNFSNGDWTYADIRNVNIVIDKYLNDELPAGVESVIGEAFWFRAYFYYNLLRRYGDVPWVDKTLETNSDELFSSRTPRSVIADNIMNDLDQAIAMLPLRSVSNGTRVNKEVALLLKSRVALYEGTWEKYHKGTDYGVANSNEAKYFQSAAETAKNLIDLNSVNIYSTGNVQSDYGKLFNSDDLSNVKEALLWQEFDVSLSSTHKFQYYGFRLPGNTGLTKSLVDDYLCTDGKPISISPLYQGDHSLLKVIENRDARLHQMIIVNGDVLKIVNGQVVETFDTWFGRPWINETGLLRSTTGYHLKKGGNPSSRGMVEVRNTETARPYFRYAEALLNYAEAKAELGTITQSDIDLSVNILRSRAGVAGLNMANITDDINWNFPALSPVINEIRRERRVELACEGLRFDDLARWRAHHLIVGQRPKGIWFDQSLYPDLVIGTSVYVDDEGYVDYAQKSNPTGWQFNPSRDYLLPVPTTEITLNSNLIQNPGW